MTRKSLLFTLKAPSFTQAVGGKIKLPFLLTLVAAGSVPAFATVTVSSPKSGATVTSAATFQATATTNTCAAGVASMGIYVDNQLKYVVSGASMNTSLPIATGTHYVVVQEWDYCNGASLAPGLTLTSTASSGGGVLGSHSIPSLPLSTFQNSLGVNVHMEYTDGLYVNESQVLSDLKYIGVTHVRDQTPTSSWAWQGLPNLEALMQSGIKFNLTNTCYATAASQLTQAEALEQEYPGSITSMEGTDEINNEPCPGSSSSLANANAFQTALYQGVHGSSVFSGIPVLYYTGNPTVSSISGLADATNTHPYPADGVQPWARLQSDFNAYFTGASASAPRYITETGYQTQYTGTNPNFVDNSAQAEMILNVYFDAAAQGVVQTYIYQLLEPYAADSGPGTDSAFGMFSYSNGAPLPSAQALNRLSTYLPADKASSQVSVSPAIATYNSSNQLVDAATISTVHSLALTASNGDQYVCVWNELPVWNSSANSRIDNTPLTMNVQLPGTWKDVTYFRLDETGSAGLQDQGSNVAVTAAGTTNGSPYYQGLLGSSPSCFGFHK